MDIDFSSNKFNHKHSVIQENVWLENEENEHIAQSDYKNVTQNWSLDTKRSSNELIEELDHLRVRLRSLFKSISQSNMTTQSQKKI